MPPVPESAFRVLLADLPRSAFVDFVTDLWRARGYEVRRDGDRLVVDGRVLEPVEDATVTSSAATHVVAATPSADADDAVGPRDLRRMLLYDVPRERAAELFEAHFGRPLDDDWSDLADDAREPADSTKPSRRGNDAPPVLPSAVRRLLVAGAARLPRNRRELQTSASDLRVLAVVCVVLVLSGAGWWGLFVHQPGPTSPSALPFETSDPGLVIGGSYRVAGQVHTTVDGETFSVRGSRTYVPGEPPVVLARWTYGGHDDRTTIVRYVHNSSYTRQTWSNALEYRRFRDSRVEDDDFVRAIDASRTVYTADLDARDVDSGQRLPLSVLGQVPYDQRETTTYQGREVIRYVPRTGWVTRMYGLLDDRQTTRTRAVSGEVLVDPRSGVVVYADLRATVVRGDTRWAARTNSPVELRVRYAVEWDVERPDTPPWVTGIVQNETAPGGNA